MCFQAHLIYLTLTPGLYSHIPKNMLSYENLGNMRMLWRLTTSINNRVSSTTPSSVKTADFDVPEHHLFPNDDKTDLFHMAGNET